MTEEEKRRREEQMRAAEEDSPGGGNVRVADKRGEDAGPYGSGPTYSQSKAQRSGFGLERKTEGEACAAGGGSSRPRLTAAVGKPEDKRKPERFSGHRKAEGADMQLSPALTVTGGSGMERVSSDADAGSTGPFRYSLDGDALYQMYRDRYLENAKRSMRDTMGQAASLTGGYGSSYSQAAGQQAYDETLRGLTDLIPTLQRDAYECAQQQYANLSASILKSGYAPNEDELAAAGMSREEAEALRQAWITGNPGAAWLQGALTPEQYTLLTGRRAPGTKKAASSGGGGGGRKKSSQTNTRDKASSAGVSGKDQALRQALRALGAGGGGRNLDAVR